MKKITFIYPQMVMGGAEKVLLRFIDALDKKEYSVNAVLLRHGGELENELSKRVPVLYAESKSLSESRSLKEFLQGGWYRLQIRLARTYEEESVWSDKVLKIPEGISEDCVIAYSHFNFMSIWLVSQTKAKHKFLFVHNKFRENMNKKLYSKALENFDKVFCVSQFAKDGFDKAFPQYREKSEVMYNLVDRDSILQKAGEKISEEMQGISLVTVARLSEEKGMRIIPEILRRILASGLSVNWYLVGDGPERGFLEQAIKELQLQGHLLLLGNRDNPFPYMKYSTVYVQPSYYEGFCTTTNEARILCKPVVASNIAPMREQFADGENGLLVDLTPEAFADGIIKLLKDQKLRKKLSENLSKVKFDNEAELQKFYRALE